MFFFFFSIIVKPLSVNIVKKHTEMVANQVYSLTCEAKGSKPPAVITWWKDDKLMNVTLVSCLIVL